MGAYQNTLCAGTRLSNNKKAKITLNVRKVGRGSVAGSWEEMEGIMGDGYEYISLHLCMAFSSIKMFE